MVKKSIKKRGVGSCSMVYGIATTIQVWTELQDVPMASVVYLSCRAQRRN